LSRRRKKLKAAVYLVVTAALLWSLTAILVTGPILVRQPAELELPYEIGASPERLRRDVEFLCGDLAPRQHVPHDNLDRTAEWIAGEFRSAGLEVEYQDYELAEGRFRNVIGFREGLEADAPVRVIGAHYDAYGSFPGADDNASGVAVLLELVRTLPPARPKRSQYFVAFSTEEPPFFSTEGMGSHVFARKMNDEGMQIDLMISLDLVGYYTEAPGSQRFPVPGMGLLYPRTGNFLAVVGDLGSGASLKRVKWSMGRLTDLPIRSFRGPAALPGVLWSDHRSFRQFDMPGVLLTDTAHMRYPWYHTEDDTPDKLDYDRMAEIVRGLHAITLDRDVAK
jgi:hypothetical protein